MTPVLALTFDLVEVFVERTEADVGMYATCSPRRSVYRELSGCGVDNFDMETLL